MNRSDLVKRMLDLYPYMGMQDASKIVDIILSSIIETIKKNGRAEFRGFGSFGIKIRTGYITKNPATGNIMNLNERRLPYFKAGKYLNEIVNMREVMKQ